jgi:hypothetical protein
MSDDDIRFFLENTGGISDDRLMRAVFYAILMWRFDLTVREALDHETRP